MTAVFSLNHYSIPVQERAGRSGVPFTLLPPGNANDWRRWTARQRFTTKGPFGISLIFCGSGPFEFKNDIARHRRFCISAQKM